MCMTSEKSGFVCECGCAKWVTRHVDVQCDTLAGMTNHDFNALNSDAVEGKASVRLEKPWFHCAQLRQSLHSLNQGTSDGHAWETLLASMDIGELNDCQDVQQETDPG